MMRAQLQTGFSLLELIVVIAVAAMVFGIGVPGFLSIIQNNRIVAVSNDLVTSIHIARSEAIKNRTNTVICASDDPEATAPVCGTDLSRGWVAFIDRNGNGSVDANANPDLDDRVIRVRSELEGSIVPNFKGNAYMAFSGSGFGRSIASLGTRATAIVLCDSRGNKDVADGISAARAVVLTETGRPETLRHVAQVTANGGCH